MDIIKLAKDIIEQWHKYDFYRQRAGDELLYSDGVQPDEVALAKALIKLYARDDDSSFQFIQDHKEWFNV